MEAQLDIMKEAVREALTPVIELQKLAVKPTLSAKEVEKLYGISTKRLELMRAESRGPAYVQLSERGTVMYQKDELERWLKKNVIVPRSI